MCPASNRGKKSLCPASTLLRKSVCPVPFCSFLHSPLALTRSYIFNPCFCFQLYTETDLSCNFGMQFFFLENLNSIFIRNVNLSLEKKLLLEFWTTRLWRSGFTSFVTEGCDLDTPALDRKSYPLTSQWIFTFQTKPFTGSVPYFDL